MDGRLAADPNWRSSEREDSIRSSEINQYIRTFVGPSAKTGKRSMRESSPSSSSTRTRRGTKRQAGSSRGWNSTVDKELLDALCRDETRPGSLNEPEMPGDVPNLSTPTYTSQRLDLPDFEAI